MPISATSFLPSSLLAGLTPQQQQALQGVVNTYNQNEAARQARDQGINQLAQQLGAQASQYGFSWEGNMPAAFHEGKMAKILYDKGVRNLNDLGYTPDGKNMINKATGQIVPWYKDEQVDAKGRAQIGWESEGPGLTNYYAQRGPNGQPIFVPQWKDESPGGLGGFLLKAAPIAAAIAGQPELAAGISAAEGLGAGKSPFEVAKGAGLSYLGGQIGQGVSGSLADALGKTGSNIAGGAASGAFGAGARGGNVLQGALTGGAGAGLYQGYKDLTSTPGLTTSGAEGGLSVRNGNSFNIYDPSRVSSESGLRVGSFPNNNQSYDFVPPSQPSGQGLNLDAGAFQTGLMFDQPSSSQPRYGTSQGLGNTADSLAKSLIGSGLNYALSPTGSSSARSGNQQNVSGGGGGGGGGGSVVQYGQAPVSLVNTVGTQGLGGYNPGDISSQTTGNPRQNVWNEASLRLKDALGV